MNPSGAAAVSRLALCHSGRNSTSRTTSSSTIEERRIVSPTVVNVIRASFSRPTATATMPAVVTRNGANPLQFFPGHTGLNDGAVSITSLSAFGENITIPFVNAQNRFTESDDILWTKGAHSLRFGMSLSRFQTKKYTAYRQSPVWTFSGGLTQFLTGTATSVTGVNYNSPISPYGNRDFRDTELTPYAQDDWKVTSRLTLNLGIRWQMMTNRGGSAQLTVYDHQFRAPTTGISNVQHVFPSNPSWHNFDPRFGFAYDAFADHMILIRGGFGLFHQLIVPADYSTGFSSATPQTQVLQRPRSIPTHFWARRHP